MRGIELSEKGVRLYVSARDWEEAVHIDGKILVRSGTVKESYMKGTVDSVREYKPYVVISRGSTIPRIKAEDDSPDIGFSLITLKEPVYFDPRGSSVGVVIYFSAVDSQTHLGILKMIAAFIEKGYVERITKLDTIDKLSTLLQNRG